MLFLPKRWRTGACVIAAFQAFVAAALFLGVFPHRSPPTTQNVPSRDNWLARSRDYLETSQDADDLDGRQDKSGLVIMILDVLKIRHGLPLKPSHNHFADLSAIVGYSLIRSPPAA
jgi:hypothetical protein